MMMMNTKMFIRIDVLNLNKEKDKKSGITTLIKGKNFGSKPKNMEKSKILSKNSLNKFGMNLMTSLNLMTKVMLQEMIQRVQTIKQQLR
jgi:hypothetical protein